MAGRWYDEWNVADELAHEIRRTVTETDNLLITTLTHNPQPLHLDQEAAERSEHGRILVNGTFTFALMIGLSVGDTTLGTLVANLGYDKVVMPSPVFVGDTLRAESVVVALKDSRSRPKAGIVTFRHRLLNQRNQIVCEGLRTALLHRKPQAEVIALTGQA
jgi:acyl dehydratase